MAYHHFRFANSDNLNSQISTSKDLGNFSDISIGPTTHFSDHTLYLPLINDPWPTYSPLNLTLTDACFHLAPTLKPLLTSTINRPGFIYADNDFNLPRGFLTSHPTVDSVLTCDTKLLPNNPVAPGPYLAQFKNYFTKPMPTATLQHHSVSDYDIYNQVIAHNCPNYIGAKIDLNPQFPVKTWEKTFSTYSDQQIVDFMRYGWPTSYMGDQLPILSLPNHASSIRQPEAVQSFLTKELKLKGLAGPFAESPFEWLRSNPMMTREKKQSDEYRVILDLSFPEGLSVNASIPKLLYEGAPYKLRLPTCLDLADLVLKHGQGTLLYKVDLSRAYRQLPADPHDWPLLGISWNEQLYFDRTIPFGLRHGAMCCQRVTSGICHAMKQQHDADALAYIDDFAGSPGPDRRLANTQYLQLLNIIHDLGMTPALDKCSPPSTCMS